MSLAYHSLNNSSFWITQVKPNLREVREPIARQCPIQQHPHRRILLEPVIPVDAPPEHIALVAAPALHPTAAYPPFEDAEAVSGKVNLDMREPDHDYLLTVPKLCLPFLDNGSWYK